MADEFSTRFFNNLAWIAESEQFSDVVIIYGDYGVRRAHKVILSCQSDWFAKAINDGWEASVFDDNITKIYLDDDPSYETALRIMILYMYGHEYSGFILSDPLEYARIYIVARKYGIVGLLEQSYDTYLDAVDVLTLTNNFDLTRFIDLIKFVYANATDTDTSRRLRDAVLCKASQYKIKLLRDHDFILTLQNNGEFARELLQHTNDVAVGLTPLKDNHNNVAESE